LRDKNDACSLAAAASMAKLSPSLARYCKVEPLVHFGVRMFLNNASYGGQAHSGPFKFVRTAEPLKHTKQYIGITLVETMSAIAYSPFMPLGAQRNAILTLFPALPLC
jgi:hypothetical protein